MSVPTLIAGKLIFMLVGDVWGMCGGKNANSANSANKKSPMAIFQKIICIFHRLICRKISNLDEILKIAFGDFLFAFFAFQISVSPTADFMRVPH
ncbi:hypothetical protein [Methanorbis rubei]|uniref:Uncharacterized protein n=1 Tax=Methanorbis rubei TaxID=3028300 RepID=A0AAE4SC51_9EURY|nr:hypothetical protein [Methanocorpusculaceae archaeon Cs1]